MRHDMTLPTQPPEAGNPPKVQAPSLRDTLKLLAGLRSSLAHHEIVDGQLLSPLLAYLSAWQSMRLSRTYADLLDDPGYRQACLFFLSDIYAPKDFSQRDYDGTRIYNFMNRFLPEATLTPLYLALQVNRMTQNLDLALVMVMHEQLGIQDHFEMAQYEEAYRLCDNFDDRFLQIDLIVETGKYLERLRRVPLVRRTLLLARNPAQRLGWHEMHDFLVRGYESWRSLQRPHVFVNTIEQRERAILNRIYGLPGGAPESNPFLVSDGGPPEIVLPADDSIPADAAGEESI